MILTVLAIVISVAILWKLCLKDLLIKVLVELCNELVKYDSVITLVTRFMSMSVVTVDVQAKVKWIEIRGAQNTIFIPLPYNRRLSSREICLLYDDGMKRNLNYPGGVPFLCTAKEIGCNTITVTDKDGVVREFEGDERIDIIQ